MDEKKLFNAYEGLKGFDPTAKGSGPRPIDVPMDECITQTEWDGYTKAKEACEKRGGNWQRERNERHDKIARMYATGCRIVDDMC
ncbi:hypothetical protein [Maribellus sp. YY47]|uniref:hypothetical protein n=1 Tax=Maribellus sp. YY47 TaxID=2929486 RepID=UPI0020017BDE|nr:hypothetical protein [Maribellus sp. YY47]MCK3683989.1 hypothetical protein [Maribellus sp. YY47]